MISDLGRLTALSADFARGASEVLFKGLPFSEVGMRFLGPLLLSLFMLGCGAGSGRPSPHPITSVFRQPTLTAVLPNSVPVNSAPFLVTINGTDFLTDAVVFWNGNPLNTRFVTANQVVATLTPTDLMTVGLIPVFVRTGGQNSNTVDFNITPQ